MTRILMAMSGGIDSSVAAMLLLEQGYELVGVTFRTFDSIRESCLAKEKGCCSVESIMEAKHLAEQLGFEHHILDYREIFRQHVIRNFTDEYMRQNTLEKLYQCLKDETNEVIVEEELAEKALAPIERMLALS